MRLPAMLISTILALSAKPLPRNATLLHGQEHITITVSADDPNDADSFHALEYLTLQYAEQVLEELPDLRKQYPGIPRDYFQAIEDDVAKLNDDNDDASKFEADNEVFKADVSSLLFRLQIEQTFDSV